MKYFKLLILSFVFCISCKQQTLEEIHKQDLIDREIVKNCQLPEQQIQQVIGNQVLFGNGDIYTFERVSDMTDERKKKILRRGCWTRIK